GSRAWLCGDGRCRVPRRSGDKEPLRARRPDRSRHRRPSVVRRRRPMVSERVVARPEVCVGAVVVHDDRLLLVRRGRGAGAGLWSVPGGRVEPAERLEAAVIREAAEETGLQVVVDGWIGWVERIGPGYHFVIHDFAVSLAPGVVPDDAVSGDDATDVRWQLLETLRESSDLVPGLVEFLAEHGVVPAP